MNSVKSIKNLKGKKVLVRVDFNVPIQNGKVMDDFRIKKALPIIQYLQSKKAKVILLAHLGEKGTETLAPVAKKLSKYVTTKFVSNIDGVVAQNAILKMQPGDVVLLENLRQNPGEVQNDKNFARTLASLGEVYVNEAFSVSHRAHASIVGIPKYLPSYAGFQLEAEIKHLSIALKPPHPFFFILGGAKFDTKMPLIKKFLKTADRVFIGGALANDFFKQEGYEVGISLLDKGQYNLKTLLKNTKLVLPVDVVAVAGKKSRVTSVDGVLPNESILDVGPATVSLIEGYARGAKLVVWNGPMGNYEHGFEKGTDEVLKALSEVKGKTILGGGDTADLADKLHLEDSFTFVSTGGGAAIEFLAKGTLPGIKALK